MLNNKSSGVAIRSCIGSGDQISIVLNFDVRNNPSAVEGAYCQTVRVHRWYVSQKLLPKDLISPNDMTAISNCLDLVKPLKKTAFSCRSMW